MRGRLPAGDRRPTSARASRSARSPGAPLAWDRTAQAAPPPGHFTFESGTLRGVPNPPAMVRGEQSSPAPHANRRLKGEPDLRAEAPRVQVSARAHQIVVVGRAVVE